MKLAPRIRVASRDTADRFGASSDKFDPKFSGGDFEEATPDPIPNSEVKLFGADGTAREAVWESRTPPGFSLEGSSASAGGPSCFCPGEVSHPVRVSRPNGFAVGFRPERG